MALSAFLSGCSGFGKFVHDTASLPGANPNMPEGTSENLARVRGHSYVAEPILPASGNVWPGAPQPLPTLRDVESSPHGLTESLSDPNSYFGAMATNHGEGHDNGPLFDDGGVLSIGEHDNVVNGVRPPTRPSLPSSVEDNAGKYISPSRSGTIVIPNGDGTTTLIAPDGTVRVTKDGAASKP
ncbi:hypothetical protein AA21291_2123 [Swaminathania salitolerans LMG 21291]|nr:hypothetical protein AA21291_2123 [Swaminathania salitolerans LMG 21291]